MLYEVKYACGHVGTVNITGKSSERENRLNYLATCDCVDCYKAKKEQECQAFEAAEKLPQLSGSEKQIAWAKTIRREKLNEIKEFLNRFKSDEGTKAFEDWAKNQSSAAFWIENRNASAGNLAKMWNAETKTF